MIDRIEDQEDKIRDEEARKLILKELEEKLPKVARAIKYNQAKVSTRNYITRKDKKVYELVAIEKKRILYNNRMHERKKITIVTLFKDTREIKISVRG